MIKRMTARYPGTCTTCKGSFATGTPISWDSVSRAAQHQVCPQTQRSIVGTATATEPPPVERVEPLVDLRAFLDRARERGLKAPAVRFLGPSNAEMRLRLKPANDFRNPNAIVVTIERVAWGQSFVGTISPSGEVTDHLRTRKDVLECLRVIERNPALAAATYAALTCRCSFCGLPLTDEGSVTVGYGPICAANYDLPHEPWGVPTLQRVPVAAATFGHPTPIAGRFSTEEANVRPEEVLGAGEGPNGAAASEPRTRRAELEELYGTKEDI